MSVLSKRNIVVGVSGGIAAFKAVELVRELGRRGAQVRVVMSASATRFVGPMTFSGLTGTPAVVDLWDPSYAGEVHVDLAGWADAIVVAPATMNVLAKLASGTADDALTATLACARGSVVLAPAMHTEMWRKPSTQRNVAQLRADGHVLVGPVEGPLASGESGPGRMSEPGDIADAVEACLSPKDFHGLRVVISAGPTFEDLDPVRFLGNRSSGRMGFAVARVAAQRGAEAILVTGPSALPTPSGVTRIDIRSARDLERVVHEHVAGAHAVVMAAAVADYRPAKVSPQKIKKSEAPLTVALVRNPDVLQGLGQMRTGTLPVLVGFALETEDVIEHAQHKLEHKRADLIVANHADDGLGGDDNVAILVDAQGHHALGRLSKADLAHRILDWVAARLRS